MNSIKKLLFLFVFSLITCAILLSVYAFRPLHHERLPLAFTIKEGSSLRSTAQQMHQAGVIGNNEIFILIARLAGKANAIKPGDYLLEKPVTPAQLLEILSKGMVERVEVTIIEGATFRELRAILNAHPKLRHDTVNLSDSEILQRIGASEAAAEGLFFPDTYRFFVGSSDLELLRQSYRLMSRHLVESWQRRQSGLPLDSPYQALILASIIEKETGQAGDRDKISAVFHNRLRKNMLLQTDPTVIYGMGEHFDGNLRKRDLLTDTPYNTYTRAGLPPTPIALPGLAALRAALNPAPINALYFVGRGDGTTQFSASLSEHNHAVDRYQK